MSPMPELVLGVSEAIALVNQTLEYAYPVIVVEGEVSSYKVNQNKYVFFDLKDDQGTLGCFMTVYTLRTVIEDGMRVRVVAQPRLTNWGKFSLTVREVRPVGEGSLRRAFELLKSRLDKEGIFAPDRKRPLPIIPRRIGVISSTQAAGYADFMKILSDRWGGLDIIVAHTQVQGADAPSQMIRALDHLNQLSEPLDVIALLRGGGSQDDLSAFNDEPLVRAVASSRTPIISGVGHEVDESLVDLAADVRASTPSNAAQVLVPDRSEVVMRVQGDVGRMIRGSQRRIVVMRDDLQSVLDHSSQRIERRLETMRHHFLQQTTLLHQLDPRTVLLRGYGLVRDETGRIVDRASVGDTITIETRTMLLETEVQHVKAR